MQGELRVRVTGDATGFNKTLQTAKTNATQFNAQLVSQNKKLVQQNDRIQKVGMAGTRAIAVSNAASQLGGIPGMGRASGAINATAGAFFGLKEAASAFGISMLKASGVFAAFTFAIVTLTKLYQEAYGLSKHLNDQLETQIREGNQKAKTEKAYLDVLKENRKSMKEEEYRRLRKGVLLGDRGVMSEIRGRFGGTKSNKALQEEAYLAQIEAMPDGYRKSVALENIRYSDRMKEARQRVGDNPSLATQRIAAQLYGAIRQEHQNKLLEIQQRQLKELQGIKDNTKDNRQYSINPFK